MQSPSILILVYLMANKGRVDIFTEMDADNLLGRFYSTQSEAKLCYFWERSHILAACKSVVKIIALIYCSYQPETICPARGSLVTKYVDHCILWCHENADIRHRMWVGFWHKYGID